MTDIINNKVFVTCWTYNQSCFIKDTMDGFCMQQTDFPFVCGIIDDASTDGEPECIQNYIEQNFETAENEYYQYDETEDYRRVFSQHKLNKNCFFVVVYLKYNHHQLKKSKSQYVSDWYKGAIYQALCEGDDYWINPLKLQKQVDFMDSHPKHSLCFCAHKVMYPSGETKDVLRYEDNKEECSMQDVILGGGEYMATNSMLYRTSMYVPYTIWVNNCPVGDLPMMLSLANNGLVGYLADLMCVYRKSTAGSWTQRMASNKKKRRQHHHAILKMWSQFDKYSNYQYHDVIVKKKRNNMKAYLKGEVFCVLSTLKNKFF